MKLVARKYVRIIRIIIKIRLKRLFLFEIYDIKIKSSLSNDKNAIFIALYLCDNFHFQYSTKKKEKNNF